MPSYISYFPTEMPFSNYLKVPAREFFKGQDGEIQLPHSIDIGISFLIIFQRIIPTICYSRFANELQGVAFPISGHKRYQVALIPGICLTV